MPDFEAVDALGARAVCIEVSSTAASLSVTSAMSIATGAMPAVVTSATFVAAVCTSIDLPGWTSVTLMAAGVTLGTAGTHSSHPVGAFLGITTASAGIVPPSAASGTMGVCGSWCSAGSDDYYVFVFK